jgi:phosphatidylglycerol:prolipoprotein diacylglycerol transferase
MLPDLLHIPFLHTYGVLVALAFLVALWITGKLARVAGMDVDSVLNLGIYCAMAAILGAKVMMLVVDLPYYVAHPGEIFTLTSLQAGGVFYGGLIAALATAFFYLRRTKLPPLMTADLFAPGIALGHGIGRLGCLAAGCCWGVPSNLPWAVTFTNPVAHDLTGVPLGIPLQPTQLYEAAAEFIIFGILWWRIHRVHGAGAIIGLYLMLYSTLRFGVEFVRFHEQGNLWGSPLDTSQWISLGLFAMGTLAWARAPKRTAVA